ncbi:MAG: FAD:protein FMN transferase, partial [Clostridia bacterium]|nr:FAD:protein FMN transferase [Clostridia bacterium]
QGYLSVSIVCRHSGMGDALSTALFCMTYEDGTALIDSIDGAEALWTFPDGEIKTSTGFSAFEDKSK